jgi:hypothetical protein
MKLLILALGLLATASQAGTNLIPFNSGFELGSPAGWYMWIDEKSGGNASFQTVDQGAHTGTWALEFDVKRPTRDVWQMALSMPQWTAKPLMRYQVRFWAKGPGPVKVSVSDAEKDYAWMGGFGADLTPNNWTEVVGELVTTTQSGKGKVAISVGLGSVAGKYLLDDFSIEEIGPLTH